MPERLVITRKVNCQRLDSIFAGGLRGGDEWGATPGGSGDPPYSRSGEAAKKLAKRGNFTTAGTAGASMRRLVLSRFLSLHLFFPY